MAIPEDQSVPFAGGRAGLVVLDQEHPGFRDPAYRARRDEIASLALSYRDGDPAPDIDYTDDEHATWAAVWTQLAPLYQRYAAAEVLAAAEIMALDRRRIPPFAQVNQALRAAAGFYMAPVAGLIQGGTFLRHLGRGIFLATQYVRHHSRPLYTPEPDVIHELIGHAMTLGHPLFAQLNRWFGQAVTQLDAAGAADDQRVLGILRAYWYTLEFGAVREHGQLKVIGAGLLSSVGEISRFADAAELRPLDLDECAARPFDPTAYQDVIYVAPSMAALADQLKCWLLER